MKRLIILAIVLLASSTIASAQEDAQTNVVTRTHTTETELSASLSNKEIRIANRKNRIYRYGERGYFGTAQVGILGFSPQYIAAGVKVINGYSFNPWVSLGVSVGTYYLNWSKITETIYIPVNAHLRINFLDRKVTPYFVADAGALFFMERDFGRTEVGKFKTQIKPYLHPELGIGIRFKKGRILSIGAGLPYFFPNAFCASAHIGFTW